MMFPQKPGDEENSDFHFRAPHAVQCSSEPRSLSLLFPRVHFFPSIFCGRLFALKISARHAASRHNAHVVVINHNYHGFKKPQLLFDFKNKP